MKNIQNLLDTNDTVMLYFSAPTCGVCQVLKPKLTDAMVQNFSDIIIESIDISTDPDIGAHFSVFTIPTVLIFLQGREYVRKSRHMSVDEVVRELERPYQMMKS